MESLKKKNFEKSKLHLQQSKKLINDNRVSLFIYESIKQYIYTFQENKILESQMNFGDLSLINKIFQI